MVWFYVRGGERRSCETRLALVGDGYELVVREGGQCRTEPFRDLHRLLAREHQLLTAWRAQGWRHNDAARFSERAGGSHAGDGAAADLLQDEQQRSR